MVKKRKTFAEREAAVEQKKAKLSRDEQKLADERREVTQEIVERIGNPIRLENHHIRTAVRYHPDKGQCLSPEYCDFDTYVVLLSRCLISHLEFLSVEGIPQKVIDSIKIVVKKIVGKTPSGEADSAEHGAQAAATPWITSLITPVFNVLRYLCTVCRPCSFGLHRGMCFYGVYC